MKIITENKCRDFIVLLIGVYLVKNVNISFKASLVKAVDSLYWGLHWIEGLDEYNYR